MGWKFGAILFNDQLEHQEDSIINSFLFNARKTDKQVDTSQIFSGLFQDTAIGYYRGKTVLVNPIIPYQFTSDLEFDEKPIAFNFLENLSRDYDILCVHLHSVAGVYGHCLFSKGKRVITVYKSNDEFIVNDASVKEEEIKLIEKKSYGERFILNLIETFLETSFTDFLKNEQLTFAIYKTSP